MTIKLEMKTHIEPSIVKKVCVENEFATIWGKWFLRKTLNNNEKICCKEPLVSRPARLTTQWKG